jgi:Holliday junction resolvasome RuvABC endonuclease subunit
MKPAGTGFPSVAEILGNPLPASVQQGRGSVELALDISSSCVGWAIGANRKAALHYGKFVFKSTAEIGEKLVSFEEFLNALLTAFGPTRLLIEKPPARRGDTTARHFELVGIVRKVWRSRTDKEILKSWFIPPRTIKRVMNVRSGNNHTDNKKIMVNKINSLFQLSLKFHPNSSLQSDDDVADAIAVLVTYYRTNVKAGKAEA